LKVFDDELVARYGKETQLGRINRERALVGQCHPNLVEIYDGGECSETGCLFVAMEFVDAPNLRNCLAQVPVPSIWSILCQIAAAAKFLEELGLVHRDIKPENIAVSPDFSRAVLLDLGVLRPFGDPSLTDEDSRNFVGTLQYSSPEFLFRTEQDTLDGWRAVTFYQLGAVLHDLIMRRPLFADFTDPYAVLVEAVRSRRPQIYADNVPQELHLLAQNCLVKSPDARLQLVTWDDFCTRHGTRRPADAARDRVNKRSLLQRTEGGNVDNALQSTKILRQRITKEMETIIRGECAGNSAFPPMEVAVASEEKIQVDVKFAATERCCLQHDLLIRFTCEILDELSTAVRLLASACVLQTGTAAEAPRNTSLFRGSVENSIFKSRIQEILWVALDLGQRHCANFNGADATEWFDLTNVFEGSQ
jgi:serine/threonine protein kinase